MARMVGIIIWIRIPALSLGLSLENWLVSNNKLLFVYSQLFRNINTIFLAFFFVLR